MTARNHGHRPPTLMWDGGVDGVLEILDQRRLPAHAFTQRIETIEDLWQAFRSGAIRGDSAVAVAGAYGMVLAGRGVRASSQAAMLIEHLKERAVYLKSALPAAGHLEKTVDQMVRTAVAQRGIGVRALQQRLLKEAHAIREADVAICQLIGREGAVFVKKNGGILTHGNPGALAAADHGVAFSILYEAQRNHIPFEVFVAESRPLLRGARLAVWELQCAGIDVTLICDSAAAVLMQLKKISLVLVGAARVARNGDVVAEAGTYSLAVLAKAHHVPFVVAAPVGVIDPSLQTGKQFEIVEGPPEEITHPHQKPSAPGIAPEGTETFNPIFDVTPAELISALVTDLGVISPVHAKEIKWLMEK